MAGNARYGLHIVQADAANIMEITGHSVAPNVDNRRLSPHGLLDPTVSVRMGQIGAIRFSTLMVGTALGAIGINGLDVTTGLIAWFVERAAGGGFLTTGEKVAAAKCLVVPESLRATQDGFAEISYLALPYSSNGAAAAFDHTAGAALPVVATVTELFTLASVTVNSTPLGKVLDWNLAFGIPAEVLKSGGNLYPTDAIIRGPRLPTFDVRVADVGELSDARLVGAEVSNVVLNLKKLSTTGGGFAGSGHKTITAAKAFEVVADASGQHPGDGSVTLHYEPRKDGASAILAVG